MLKIAVYGKGGIGKSTVTSNLAAAFAQLGKIVVQIGCDPKADSTINLLKGKTPVPVMNFMRDYDRDPELDEILERGYGGVCCIETGGPTPGLGCAGRGIVATFDLLDELELFEREQPDVVLFDGEKMALYAADNIYRAVENFRDRSYARVRGLVMNRRNIPDEEEKVRGFAAERNLDVVADIPRSDEISRCEDEWMTAVEGAPESDAAQRFRALAELLLADGQDAGLPEAEDGRSEEARLF